MIRSEVQTLLQPLGHRGGAHADAWPCQPSLPTSLMHGRSALATIARNKRPQGRATSRAMLRWRFRAGPSGVERRRAHAGLAPRLRIEAGTPVRTRHIAPVTSRFARIHFPYCVPGPIHADRLRPIASLASSLSNRPLGAAPGLNLRQLTTLNNDHLDPF